MSRPVQYDDEKARPCTSYLELHFPKEGRKDQCRQAKMVCFSCQVRVACLNGALERNEQYGMFGGMTTRERGVERKRRGIAGRPPSCLSPPEGDEGVRETHREDHYADV